MPEKFREKFNRIKELYRVSQKICYRCDKDREYEECCCCEIIEAEVALKKENAMGWLIEKLESMSGKMG